MDEKTVFAINEVPFEDELSDLNESSEEEAEGDVEAWVPPTEEVEYNQEAQYVQAEPQPAAPPILGTPQPSTPINESPQNTSQSQPMMRVGLFGQKIPVARSASQPDSQNLEPKPIEEPAPTSSSSSSGESALERRRRRREEGGVEQVVLCSVCAKYVKKGPGQQTCSNCNSPLF